MEAVGLLPTAVSLMNYILMITSTKECDLLDIFGQSIAPSSDLEKLLNKVHVLPEEIPPTILVIEGRLLSEDRSDLKMRNILNRFIVEHIRARPSFRERNCLSLGYRVKSDLSNNAGVRNTTDIECEYVNTIHSFLFNPSWQKLAYGLGEAVILHLLSRPMFAPGSHGCFFQISGVLINELIYQQSSFQSASMPTRTFFSRRQSLNSAMKVAAEKHLPLPQATMAIDLQVRGSTELPHFDLFYKHSYHKDNRLSLNKIRTSGSSLMAEIFGNVLCEESPGRKVRVLEEKSRKNMIFCATLENMILNVVNRYRRCDVSKALSDHDPCRVGEKRKIREGDWQDGKSVTAKKRIRRRGCRSGKAERKKFERRKFLEMKLPAVMSTNNDVLEVHNDEGARMVETDAVQAASKAITTLPPLSSSTAEMVGSMGKRLMRRLHNNISETVAFCDDGYISQERDDESQQEFVVQSDMLDEHSLRVAGDSFIKDSSQFCQEKRPNKKHNIIGQKRIRCADSDDSESIHQSLPTQSTMNSGLLHHMHRGQCTQFSSSLASTSSVKKRVDLGYPTKRLKVFGCKMSATMAPVMKYFDMSTASFHVSEFIKSVCRRTFSIDDVWGSRRNSDAFLASVDRYIKLGRNETLSVSQFVAKISINDLPWLQSKIAKQNAKSLLYAFMYWTVSDFINPLISSYFYVTEAEGRGTEVLFYRRPVWNTIIEAGFKQVGSHFLGVLENDRTLAGDVRLRISGSNASARFMPKKESLRLITNLRVKRPLTSTSTSTHFFHDSGHVSNSALYNCLHVLHHVYTRNSILSGFGSLGVSEIHAKLAGFLKRLSLDRDSNNEVKNTVDNSSESVPCNSSPPPFYVAVLDLEKCYDNVDTVQLFNLVRDLLNNKLQNDASKGGIDLGKAHLGENVFSTEVGKHFNQEDFALHKYHVSHRLTSLDRSITKTVRHLTRGDDILTFEEAAEKISRHHNNSIIADGVVVPKISNSEILKILHAHLFNHVVRMPVWNEKERRGKSNDGEFGKLFDLYTQVKGIPQGSVLSPLLCNLYYGNAERIIFGTSSEVKMLGLEKRSLILRIMDDYIMISIDRSAVQHFLQRAHQCLKPFGGGVNPLKTKINFQSDIEIDGKRVSLSKISGRFMPWCGYLIDTLTLEVRPCMDRLISRHLRFSISMECSCPAKAIRRALKSYVRMKCHPLILDRAINSFLTVYQSLYEVFLVAAMRMHACIVSMNMTFRTQSNNNYLADCISESILFVAHLASSFTKKQAKPLMLERCDSESDGESDNDNECSSECEDSGTNKKSGNETLNLFENRCSGPQTGGRKFRNGSDISLSKDTSMINCTNVRRDMSSSSSTGLRRSKCKVIEACPVSRDQIMWLGFLAFCTVLEKRNGMYSRVRSLLRKKKDLQEAKLRKKCLYFSSAVLRECNALMDNTQWL